MIRIATSGEGVYLEERIMERFDAEYYTGLPRITINCAKKYQEILGFGMAMTDASCYLIDQLPVDKRKELLLEVFGENGMNLNVARISVGASDYATEPFNYDDKVDDTELNFFSIDHDKQYVLPVLKEIKEINPDIFFFSSVWSAPGWMKTGGSMMGGWMRHQYLEVFAQYYVRFIQAYREEGIEIHAMTSQNETETDQTSKMPACYLHPEFEMELVSKHFPALFKKHGIQTKVWILDHNFNQWNRVKWMLDDKEVKRNTAGVAFHYYEGTAEMATLFHEAHPDVPIHWTEGGPNIGESYETDWCEWGHVFTDALNHWCQSITGWNLALDEEGKPNLGIYPCAGMVTIHSRTKEVSYSGQYKAMSHFSKYIQRGAKRICSFGANNGIYNHSKKDKDLSLYHCAFENPNKDIVVVITNPFERQVVELVIEGHPLKVDLRSNSITTVTVDAEML